MSGKLQLTGRMRGALRSIVPAALRMSHASCELPGLKREGVCARCYRDWPDDPGFIEQYQQLMARCTSSTVFNSLAWQSAVVNEFVPAGQFRLVTVTRDNQLLAAVPLGINTAAMLETPGRWLTDYLDPLVDRLLPPPRRGPSIAAVETQHASARFAE